MRIIATIAGRELAAYFSTPLAYVFTVTFLAAAGAAPFYFGSFMERGQADLAPFFRFHPWLLLVLIPAIGMRLWADERRLGTIELLMTLPVTPLQVVVGKFVAAWVLIGGNLLLTFPIWLSVNFLGDPDNGVIVTSYVASFLMGGAMLAITSCLSALTKSPVIAFVFAVTAIFILMLSGFDPVLNLFTGWAPAYVIDLATTFSFLTHFQTVSRGVLDAGSVVYFLSLIGLFLFINRQVVELLKAY